MKQNKMIKRFLTFIASTVFCASLNAEVIYQDNFDGALDELPYWPRFGAPDDVTQPWYVIYESLAFRLTEAFTGSEGSLLIRTEDRNSGVISRETSDSYDFFNQELTYTFDGINIEALGASHASSQWLQFGVVSNVDKSLWKSFPLFLVTYSGAGGFSFKVRQPLVPGPGIDSVPRKLFKSQVFNFDVSKLKKVEITLDSVNYKVAFSFEHELDVLSFGGAHGLDRDLWFIDKVGLHTARSRYDSAENTLAAYQEQLATAQASGTAAEIDAAQALVNEWTIIRDDNFAIYETKLAEAEPYKGDSGLIMSVSSDVQAIMNAATPGEILVDENGDIGARVTINSVTVETSNILQGL